MDQHWKNSTSRVPEGLDGVVTSRWGEGLDYEAGGLEGLLWLASRLMPLSTINTCSLTRQWYIWPGTTRSWILYSDYNITRSLWVQMDTYGHFWAYMNTKGNKLTPMDISGQKQANTQKIMLPLYKCKNFLHCLSLTLGWLKTESDAWSIVGVWFNVIRKELLTIWHKHPSLNSLQHNVTQVGTKMASKNNLAQWPLLPQTSNQPTAMTHTVAHWPNAPLEGFPTSCFVPRIFLTLLVEHIFVLGIIFNTI